ncbi:MAG: Smr/MutS family protein [Treponema sp.]|jgi:DNA-nicking Smr family endonuclease|nr:Smr/MutS family protein [Treponema sp.]
MNFGDIFSQWESRYGVYDKDAEAEDADTKIASALRRKYLRAKRPDSIIDIHGMTRDEAALALEHFFENARRERHEKILVIHGKGNHSAGDAVLKIFTKDFIERCPFAGESGYAGAAGGGSGATWVLLKLTVPGK